MALPHPLRGDPGRSVAVNRAQAGGAGGRGGKTTAARPGTAAEEAPTAAAAVAGAAEDCFGAKSVTAIAGAAPHPRSPAAAPGARLLRLSGAGMGCLRPAAAVVPTRRARRRSTITEEAPTTGTERGTRRRRRLLPRLGFRTVVALPKAASPLRRGRRGHATPGGPLPLSLHLRTRRSLTNTNSNPGVRRQQAAILAVEAHIKGTAAAASEEVVPTAERQDQRTSLKRGREQAAARGALRSLRHLRRRRSALRTRRRLRGGAGMPPERGGEERTAITVPRRRRTLR